MRWPAPVRHDADADVWDVQDENEGSIISHLVSQLRCVCSPHRLARPASDLMFYHQGRDGPVQGDVPDVRARAAQHARAHHRLHGPPGPHLRVRARVRRKAVRRG